ncbi:exosome complex component Rrp42 [Mitosporidium daphniae]|uniref:Exosome complex component Rrp42 n=1 Tax=Mitosporidium daphniae TaxID=1485682 RepID=A0A098VU36_9MICR|nr:exosome complex component Rrp42 [Mitosporidium daphniae]KGG52643.1 exosome complex component Rrp42 [Mitosporidium daphniae]|eukprot:XP_013239070.1 exosome complex component Rrp42 [Mitosporidium daphniae]
MREFQVGSSTGYWHLNADVMVRMRSFPHQVLNDAGNIFEAAFDSLAAALSSTRLPKSISDVGGIYPEDLVNNILAADPTIEEESISDAQLFLTRSSDDEISSVRKLGTGLLSFEQLAVLVASQ